MTDTPKTSDGGLKYAKRDVKRAAMNLWKYRPFTRVMRGWEDYQVVRNYIQLNEKEIRGEIRYQKNRLKGPRTAY